ncbi:MAG: right-handed parallel beta-helix repeat-containing protein, partial [Draconibacterium sp.]
ANVQITNVNAHHNGRTGIWISANQEQGKSQKIYLGYCTANDNAGDPTAFTNHSGSGIIVSQTDGALIEYCSASNNGWDMPRKGNGPVGIWAHDANNIIIQYCIAYNNESARGAADGGGFDLDGGITNSLVQYNYSYDNNGAGYGLFQYAGTTVWENNTIRYNISYNDGEGNENTGIYIWSAEPQKDFLRNCKIHNNIVINELGSAIKYSGDNADNSTDPNGFEFYNNIFVSRDEPIEGRGTKSVFSNNLWYRLDEQVISKKYDKNGIYGRQPGIIMPQPHNYRLTDPTQLKSLELFRLQENSPCLATGKRIGNQAVFNFWGEKITDNPNIGIE